MDILIDALLAWIGDNTDYDVADIPPPIVLQVSPAELTREFYTDLAHLIPDDGVDERLNGLYAFNNGPHGTIYLVRAADIFGAEDFDDPTENPLFREILLHELVHHVQRKSGAFENWPCPAIGETEAYRLGGRYLRQTRTTDPLGNRNFWAAIYARC
ncbi:DUF6647 family protein [Maliponia aquimaris]|uniref:DUF6647 domain-containing protein n=1 Tax=Maliponia aquimaris TaxID=1673631 RepID=A0A238K175_9RHOB|nr:DUF6647 family protein [Maliponia aquimaris]SMX36104.1 hypothetical protein MAA8898_00753 [Maliponia aquimaris]